MTIYAKVLDQIIADMERGKLPWRKSWKGDARRGISYIPCNAVTGKPYRGINVFTLWMRALELGVDNDMRFLTFKQAQDAGGNVKKGEKAAYIMFFKPLEIEQDNGDVKKIPMMKTYAVFHVSQCENLGDLAAVSDEPCTLPEDCDEFISTLGMNVRHGGDTAAHIPASHTVVMPFPADFECLDAYRATLYHETIHWMRNNVANASYAFEELVAEFGAAFLCAEFGIEYRLEHVAYLQHWVAMLKDKPRALYQAASAAQKTVDAIRAKILGEAVQEMAA